MKEQPKPKMNKEICIQDQVAQDIMVRKEIGRERYGTVLQPYNGRNSVQDAYEEALDLVQYMKQMLIERKEMIELIKRGALNNDPGNCYEVFLKKIGEWDEKLA